MTRYYKAVFSNGAITRRSTTSRIYSHSWLVIGQRPAGHLWTQSGFSRSERLATQAMHSFKFDTSFAEVAPAVEITRKEYEALA